eukprot:1036972-Pyramimonas_sp.AAC.1
MVLNRAGFPLELALFHAPIDVSNDKAESNVEAICCQDSAWPSPKCGANKTRGISCPPPSSRLGIPHQL